MTSSKRTLLIVEDDRDLNFIYTSLCQLALSSLSEAGLQVDPTIIQAYNYEEASRILGKESVDFLSIDLALQEKEKGLKEEDRLLGQDPGGMLLLKDLQTVQKRPVVVVVSGETLLSYAKDALQKYGVLAYYQKSQPNHEEEYQHVVQAALWYFEAADLLSKLESSEANPDIIDMAENCWKNAKVEATKAGIGEGSFPYDFGLRIASVHDRLDVTAKVPGDQWTEQVLRKRIMSHNDWILAQIQIKNFASFATTHSSQVGPLLFYVANQLKETAVRVGCQDTFVGIWRREHVIGPCILVIFNQKCHEHVEPVISQVVSQFRERAHSFLHIYDTSKELKKQSLSPDLATRIWSGVNQPFGDWHQMVDQLGTPIL